MRTAEVDKLVLAFVLEHPGATARDVAAELGNPMTRSRERAQANAGLKRLGDAGRVVAEGYPQRWTAVDREPIHDPEYVEIVIGRLAELWKVIPVEHRHAVEWCMVDLQRALGINETGVDHKVDARTDVHSPMLETR